MRSANVECDRCAFGESGTTGGGGDDLIVMAARTKEISEFSMLAAEARGRITALEATHTSDPSLDAAVILLEPVIIGHVELEAAPSGPAGAEESRAGRCMSCMNRRTDRAPQRNNRAA